MVNSLSLNYLKIRKMDNLTEWIFIWGLLIRSSFIIIKFINILNPKASRRWRFFLPHLLNRILHLRFTHPSSSSSESPLDFFIHGVVEFHPNQKQKPNFRPHSDSVSDGFGSSDSSWVQSGCRQWVSGGARSQCDGQWVAHAQPVRNRFRSSGNKLHGYEEGIRWRVGGCDRQNCKFCPLWFCLVTEKIDGKVVRHYRECFDLSSSIFNSVIWILNGKSGSVLGRYLWSWTLWT